MHNLLVCHRHVTKYKHLSDLEVVSDTNDNLLVECDRAFTGISRRSAQYTAAACNVTVQARLIHVHKRCTCYLQTNDTDNKIYI